MRKYYTLVFIVLISFKAIAQSFIPNPSFENWSVDSAYFSYTGGTLSYPYSNPSGWATLDSLSVANLGTSEVTQSTTSYSGKYAAQLETQLIAWNDIGNVPGIVLLGNINFIGETISSGVPFTARPDSLNGYYQYSPAYGAGTDSCFAFIYLTKWNKTTNKRDSVGSGEFKSGFVVTQYTKFSVQLSYTKSETPDTIQLGISSSSRIFAAPFAGSIMLVDSLYFSVDTSSGVNILSNKGFSISCYPNPANTNLNILISEPNREMLIKVYDYLGRNILLANVQGLITSIDVSKLSNGAYFYEVFDNSGKPLKSDKFSVTR